MNAAVTDADGTLDVGRRSGDEEPERRVTARGAGAATDPAGRGSRQASQSGRTRGALEKRDGQMDRRGGGVRRVERQAGKAGCQFQTETVACQAGHKRGARQCERAGDSRVRTLLTARVPVGAVDDGQLHQLPLLQLILAIRLQNKNTSVRAASPCRSHHVVRSHQVTSGYLPRPSADQL